MSGWSGSTCRSRCRSSYHSFGGWKRSGFGDIGQYGQEGLRFWTKNKVVTQRWPDGGAHGENAFNIPTMA